ncbi:MAG: aldo/keto reductase [Ilumatobacteraceae bacterium]
MTEACTFAADPIDRFGFGCVKLGGSSSPGSAREAERLVRTAVDAGVTLFDTADAYGAGISEMTLGRALGRDRSRVTIATKGGYLFNERSSIERKLRSAAAPVVRTLRRRGLGDQFGRLGAGNYAAQDFSAGSIRGAVEASLRRLRTDYIDIYQIHGPPQLCPSETLDLMRRLVAAGTIRAFGVGLERVIDADPWLTVDGLTHLQLPFGVFDASAREVVFPRSEQRGLTVLARAVLGSGSLESPSPAALERVDRLRAMAASLGVDVGQLAVWYSMSHREVGRVLVGLNSLDHLLTTLKWIRSPLPDAHLVDAIDEQLGRSAS